MSKFPNRAQKKRLEPLFDLADGTPVYYGDVLYHPDMRRVGWYCKAEFVPGSSGDMVTVRVEYGAVPTVQIRELRSHPPIQRRCKSCGQLLPEEE